MAKIDLKFLDSEYNGDYARVEKLERENLICIEVVDSVNSEPSQVLLDKSTAIKFAKTLRTEIAKMNNDEK